MEFDGNHLQLGCAYELIAARNAAQHCEGPNHPSALSWRLSQSCMRNFNSADRSVNVTVTGELYLQRLCRGAASLLETTAGFRQPKGLRTALEEMEQTLSDAGFGR